MSQDIFSKLIGVLNKLEQANISYTLRITPHLSLKYWPDLNLGTPYP